MKIHHSLCGEQQLKEIIETYLYQSLKLNTNASVSFITFQNETYNNFLKDKRN